MAGPGDDLFMALAQAKAQPSHAFRDAEAALSIPGQALGGYEQGLTARNNIAALRNAPAIARAQRQAALMENYGKLAEQIGPDRAISLMGQPMQDTGIDISKINAPVSRVPYSPAQLLGMGKYGSNTLEAETKAQGLDEKGPRTVDSVMSNLGAYGMPPDAAKAWISANTDKTGTIQNKNYEDLIKALTARNQGLRSTGMTGYFNAKAGAANLQQLPSEMGPNTTPGAAAQVLIGSKMGMALIAKPGSPQRTAAARADAARTILRKSPTDEALKTMDYTGNLAQRWSMLKQNLTANPDSVDNPNVRKDMYDLFKDMRDTAMPFVANHLANRESYGMAVPPDVRNREMGLNMPDVPFEGAPSSASGVPGTATDPAGLFQ